VTERRIEHKTSRTAAMTCMSRAASYLERNPGYHSDDYLAVRILPKFIALLIHISLFRRLLARRLAPLGVYEYVIARTKYNDAVFKKALTNQFDQILIFGAGYDTRSLRFHEKSQHTQIFELDEPHTQEAKIRQLQKRRLDIPSNVVFIAIDFEKESLSRKLEKGGFQKGES
jgi:methyltransferase (TIGR00027 family)